MFVISLDIIKIAQTNLTSILLIALGNDRRFMIYFNITISIVATYGDIKRILLTGDKSPEHQLVINKSDNVTDCEIPIIKLD